MKRVLYISILLSMTLEASYTKMLDHYKHHRYQSVIIEAKKSTDEYQNPQLHLLWAKSAAKLGKVQEAMSAYERVLILEPNNAETITILEEIYIKSGREGLSPDIQEDKKSTNLKAKASISYGYDSNINANPGGDILDDYYGVVGNKGAISTQFMRVTGDIDYRYKFEDYDGWFGKAILNIYSQSNFSASEYNLQVATIEAGIGYLSDEYNLYLPLQYDRVHYLDRDLMRYYRFLPKVTIPISEDILLDLGFIYSSGSYVDELDSLRDASKIGLSAGAYFLIDKTLLNINLKYESQSSDSTLPKKFIDADLITFDLALKHYFTSYLLAEVKYLFRYADYSDDIGTVATPSDISRDDYLNQIDLRFTYIWSKELELYIRDEYTDNRSSYMPTEYDKNQFMLGINLAY